MTDTTAAEQYGPPAPGSQPALSDAEKETADTLYDSIKAAAEAASRDYALAHIPPQFTDYLSAKVDADFPAASTEPLVITQYEQGRVSVQKPAVPG